MASSPTPRKLRIIYAEDSPAEQELMTVILERHGHEIACFNDGQSALQSILTGTYDLLVTDNDMPRMTGLDLVRQLRQANHPIKIIVTSGFLEADLEVEYRGLGVRSFLSKPSPEHRIIRAIEEAQL